MATMLPGAIALSMTDCKHSNRIKIYANVVKCSDCGEVTKDETIWLTESQANPRIFPKTYGEPNK